MERWRSSKWLCMVCAGLILSSFSLTSVALAKDPYPADTLSWICHSKPGSGFDIAARGFSPFLSKYLKEVSPGAKGGEINVKNVTQAMGRKAYADIYNAKPDGYTIGDINIGHVSQFIFDADKPPFDVNKFVWLVRTAMTTRLLIGNKKGLATWEEMVAASKKAPLKWSVGTMGSSGHIESAIVAETVGLQAKFLPAGGPPEQINAVLRGDVQVAWISEDSVKALAEAKEVNVLVSFTDQRLFPDVPTIKEKGYPQVIPYVGNHRLIMGPPNFDPDAKNILLAAAKKAMADPEYVTFCTKVGLTPAPLLGKDVEDLMARYIKFYTDMAPTLKKYLTY